MPVRPGTRLVLIGIALVVGVELILWVAVARDRLEGKAWCALVASQLKSASDGAFAPCISVEPDLYERTLPNDRAKLAEKLNARGIALRVAPPTHNPPFGYLDRDCIEIFVPPKEFRGLNLPILAKANIAYYKYDFNGDAVLMLQLGTTWVYLADWSEWI